MHSQQLNTYIQLVTLVALVIALFLVLEQRSLYQPRLTAVEIQTHSHASRLPELETRQTNTLVFLEHKVNRVEKKVDDAVGRLEERMQIMEKTAITTNLTGL